MFKRNTRISRTKSNKHVKKRASVKATFRLFKNNYFIKYR